ncbi:hypothetical protein PR202_gb21099 [Eleusine coracana subsp. coracana]|uniref:Gnk2-homologous domain-containing protein n=1 Tax=Eleusine coracana subsp. coracana TaxID=191504 RepID=A0AAV5FCD5_ELECO|nr:hypothetical protein PR202_gb21099 [Eleusine coracana subsp. coracana]
MAMGGSHLGISLLLVVVAALLAQQAGAQPWQLLSTTLPGNASSSSDLFAKAGVGADPDTVYALALCRGDMNASGCGSCVATAFQEAQQLCALNKDATIYYDECRCSTLPVFDAAVAALLNATADYAVTNSTRRFATGEQDYDRRSYPTLYGLTQCTPDLSPDDCRSCLGVLIGRMPQYLSGREGGRITGVRCNFRYEVYPFFSSSPSLRLPAPAPAPVNEAPTATPPGRSRNRTRIVLAIALPIVAAVLAVTLVCLCLLRKRRRPTTDLPQPYSRNPKDIESIDSLLDISTLRVATDNFAENNKLGEGGFGTVYKVQVWEHWTTGTIVEIIDSSLRGNAPMEQVLKYIHIGLLCIQDNPVDRPTMSTVNVMLSSSTVSLPAPLKPICSESHPRATQSSGLPGALSPNEVSITELEPR